MGFETRLAARESPPKLYMRRRGKPDCARKFSSSKSEGESIFLLSVIEYRSGLIKVRNKDKETGKIYGQS